MKFEKLGYLLMAVLFAAILTFSCASSGGSEGPVNEGYRWSFADPEAGVGNWDLATEDFWDFKGTIDLSRDDATLGKPMLRVDVDFSKDVGSWWSEPKLLYKFDEPLELRGLNRFSFDLYYNPQYQTRGSFKGKVVGLSGKNIAVEAELESFGIAEPVGDYLKATVNFRLRSSRSIDSLHLGIVGAVTDYNGPLFMDNIRWE